MKKLSTMLIALLLCLSVLVGCSAGESTSGTSSSGTTRPQSTTSSTTTTVIPTTSTTTTVAPKDEVFDLADVPAYSGEPVAVVHGNIPYFTEDDYTTEGFETYASLDTLGRCGVAYACVCLETMPTEPRGDIGSVKPTGWHSVQYSCVNGGSLYNRCHLLGWQLTGEDANKSNLITGTRYLNEEGMLPFENMIADHIKEKDIHVLYRVTPIFEGDNLLASGVLMEGWSVEDEGETVCFCVYAYNVQPDIEIDYATGESKYVGEDIPTLDPTVTYIANKSKGKFHYPTCSSVTAMSEKNKVFFYGTREEVIAAGYSPCGSCNP